MKLDVEDDDLFIEGYSIRKIKIALIEEYGFIFEMIFLTIQDLLLILVLNLFQFRVRYSSLNLSSLHVCTNHLAVKFPFLKILKHF